MRINETVQPGDVIAVNTGTSWAARLIRLGNLLVARRWSWANHVILVHHVDAAGTLWGVEGRPGGVGWVEISTRDYAYYSTNLRQPKTAEQRAALCRIGEQVLGTPYDWDAIARDAMHAAGIPPLWAEKDAWSAEGKAPAHVVCSSLWAWAATTVGLDRPAPARDARYVTPGDWDRFNKELDR